MPEPATSKFSWWAVALPAVAVTFAALMQGLSLLREPAPARGPRLGAAVPLELSGWKGRDVPLGPNEFMTGAVERVLNYDEALNREYTREGASFGVYVAYWGAGKMPTQLVASHTPDRCWTENGWRCLEMKFRQAPVFEGRALQPGEWRLFEPPRGGEPTYVLYWHLVEGKPYDYGERFNATPHPLQWAKDAAQQALLGNREQYFIRLTSNPPLEDLWSDPGFAAVLRGLGELGLAGQSSDHPSQP